MTAPKLDRRQVLKLEAAAMAALAGGMPLAANAANLVTERAASELKWDKAPCRFCGTGCSVMVATKDNRVVATHGDIKSEVNRGLNCVKGYFLSKIMYGHDRLTKPMLRKTNGKYDKNGEFTPVSWDEAFDIMAEKFKAALKKRGPSGVGMLGSGQWTIWEGYAGLKLMKAGFRSNNLDPNARHCMASAAVGFMRTFGIDEPMGCYDDIEAADAFVLWGSNMAEMHPILWTRVADRRLSAPHVRVAVLSTFEHRSFDLADIGMVFKPQTDLFLLNAIANHIVKTGRVNKDFVDRHTLFKRGQTDIGYGLRPEHPLEKKATGRAKAGDATDISYDEYVKFLTDYTLEKAAEMSGVPLNRLEALAELYADPKVKVTSFWTMGFNQHTRGVWCNNLIYNIHLLTGKISEPGNSPFSLTGQPSACGTAREVGTFSHRLPADMAVDHPAVAVTARARLQSGDVRARIGLGYRDRANRLTADDRRQIFLLLLRRAAQGDVHRRHVGMNEHRRGKAAEGRTSEFFRPHHRRQRTHIGAAIFGRVPHAEEAECAHAAVDLARNLAVAFPRFAMRHDFLLDEATDLLAQHPQLLRKVRLLREMKFAIGLIARIGGHDVHCDAFSAWI